MSVARVMTSALLITSRLSTGCRCRSCSRIVPTHLSRLAVMVSTTSSRSLPREALGAVQVPDLSAFEVRVVVDGRLLDGTLGSEVVAIGDCRGVSHGR